ncbi:MAG: galactose mutarotase [Lachnospiraceae bacterium]|nr:galactose mutarotase [Lachnospiraceae bacterium]MDE6183943.1 galactose mutarotase [Lachnospiraceae bacterium]
MHMKKELFGKTKSEKEIYRYWLENSKGMRAGIINYGAVLVNLFVPDKNGNIADVVLGFDTLEPYFDNGSFFGAVIGPNANRVGGAAFTLDGQRYQLDVNDGANNLHSHIDLGYHKRVWEVAEEEEGIRLFLEDQDGSMGFPGNKKIQVTYYLTEENELKIQYEAYSDKNTIINLTNHTYFNLAGHDKGQICDHVLELKASAYTPVTSSLIPVGEIASVKGTPFDFLKAKRVGDEIDADDAQLKMAGGYDHNWVIDGESGTIRQFATVTEPVSGRCLKAYTDLPGVQFYAGNFIGRQTGKNGTVYDVRSGLCLETQYFPDTANKPAFPKAVFGPDKSYKSTTIYKFCL